MTATPMEDFAAVLAAEPDERKRAALISRVQFKASSLLPEGGAAPDGNVRSARDYLAIDIDMPPSLIYPTLAVRGEITVTIGRAGKGKCSPNSTPVLTPRGWVAIGDLAAGDRVSNPVTGTSSEVVGVFPQGIKDVYRVTLNDGATLDVGLEHLFEVRRRGGWDGEVLSVQQMLDEGVRSGSRRRFALPPIEPIEFDPEVLPIRPYALGALIGDGGLSQADVRISSADREIIQRVANETGTSARMVDQYTWRLNGAYKELIPALDELGLRTTAEHKFIPRAYKYGSVSDRIELLRGLMDTDGCANSEYCSVSKRLVEDVIDVVRSLGGRAKLSQKQTSWTHNGVKHTGSAWRTRIKLPSGINPCWIARKADAWSNTQFHPTRMIESIELVGKEECTCIMVDHHRHLYISGDYVVSHNTTMNINRLISCASGRAMFPEWQDSEGIAYMLPEKPLRVLIAENEGNAGMFHAKLKTRVYKGPLTDEEREVALDNLFIYGDGGYSSLKLDNDKGVDAMRRAIEACQPDILFIEPFRSLWSGEENSSTDMAKVIDNIIMMATEYNCAVILSHHERKSGAGDDGEKMSAGRGSTVLEGAVAVIENFESVKDGALRQLSWSKSRYMIAPPPVRMEYNWESDWYEWIPEGSVDTAILAALAGSPNGDAMNLALLADTLGESKNKLRDRLKKLENEGRVKKSAGSSSRDGSTGYLYRLPTGDSDEGLSL